ncbi:MAG: transposase, partial [Anaerolineae bacterium]|nr:transposase [Anaerolineae bacterium]
FDQVTEACEQSREECIAVTEPKSGVVFSETQFITDVPLNKSNSDVRVNFLQHYEFDVKTGAVVKRFSWVTDIPIERSKLLQYQRGGRARWRIENETFNTLKNQGYCYEHNYGHGKANLSTVLMLIMFLAFTVDQIQQACCPLFQAALEKLKTRKKLWDHLRSHVRHFRFNRFRDLWAAILMGTGKNCHPPPRYL